MPRPWERLQAARPSQRTIRLAGLAGAVIVVVGVGFALASRVISGSSTSQPAGLCHACDVRRRPGRTGLD